MRSRFKLCVDAWQETYEKGKEDVEFIWCDQWDPQVRREREASGRPCFQVNRVQQTIKQIANDQRQNRPAQKVSGVDDKADPEIAEVLQGLIRHTEYLSSADTTYDISFKQALEGSIGFMIIRTEYCDDNSFDQDIKIKSVADQFSCYLDPSFEEPDGSDAEYGFHIDEMSKDEFKRRFPKSELVSFDDWGEAPSAWGDWVKKDAVRVVEYYYKEFEEKSLYQIELIDELTSESVKQIVEELPEGFPEEQILNKRSVHRPTVYHEISNGVEVLEKTKWAGRWIPIVPVLGNEARVNGKRILESAIRHSKDPQKLLNHYVSSEAEAIALSPKAPYIGPADAFKGYEKVWQTANTENHSFLPYNSYDKKGNPVAPPTRNFGEANTGAITNARMQASEDIKGTTGLYDAAVGARSNETSGVGIQRRQMQAQTANFHFVDNLSRSMRHVGRILVDLIPHIYDTERAIRVIGEDREEKIVWINRAVDPEDQNAKMISFDHGKYDVAVDIGPSYATKRQEAVDSLMEFARVFPMATPHIPDLVAGNMDWHGAKDIAERLKKTVDPRILGEDGKQQMPPEAEAQLQQMGQMIEQLTQQLNKANEEKAVNQQKIDADIYKADMKAKIDLQKIQVDAAKALLKEQGVDDRLMLELAQSGASESQIQNQIFKPEDRAQSIGPQQQPIGGLSPSTYQGE